MIKNQKPKNMNVKKCEEGNDVIINGRRKEEEREKEKRREEGKK